MKTVDFILCWLRDGGHKGFEILVDGKRVGSVGALLDTFFLNGLVHGLEPGKHDFEVRAIPWEGLPLPGAAETVTLKSRSPFPSPVVSIRTAFRPGLPLQCSSEARRGTLEVSWEPERSPISVVDVFLRRGDLPLRSVTTISGEDTYIELPDVFEDEEVALQFFDGELFVPPGFSGEFFGSPVFGGGSFRRGDPNRSSSVDISDAVMVLSYLFSGDEPIDCLDAADANDSGEVDISDGMFILNFLFSGGRAPPAPGHLECGLDVTGDELPRCLGICAGT